jgi:hypothetical protein
LAELLNIGNVSFRETLRARTMCLCVLAYVCIPVERPGKATCAARNTCDHCIGYSRGFSAESMEAHGFGQLLSPTFSLPRSYSARLALSYHCGRVSLCASQLKKGDERDVRRICTSYFSLIRPPIMDRCKSADEIRVPYGTIMIASSNGAEQWVSLNSEPMARCYG